MAHISQSRPDSGLDFQVDRLRVGWGTQDKKMSKGHLPRVVYHQTYNEY